MPLTLIYTRIPNLSRKIKIFTPGFTEPHFLFFTFVWYFIILPLMDLLRFYCNPLNKSGVELVGSESHHVASVRRLGKGDKIELFDGAGTLAVATITAVTNRKVSLKIDDLKILPRPEGPKIIIAAGIAKGERFDWLIGKATALGADRICPVIFERTVKQPKNAKIADRWLNIAISATKQCRRIFLPQIDSPTQLLKTIELLKVDYPEARFLLGSLDPDSKPVAGQSFTQQDCIAFIGPEGGLTDQEQTLLRNHGVMPVRLANTVLRIETAALAFAAILSAQRDLLNSPG